MKFARNRNWKKKNSAYIFLTKGFRAFYKGWVYEQWICFRLIISVDNRLVGMWYRRHFPTLAMKWAQKYQIVIFWTYYKEKNTSKIQTEYCYFCFSLYCTSLPPKQFFRYMISFMFLMLPSKVMNTPKARNHFRLWFWFLNKGWRHLPEYFH